MGYIAKKAQLEALDSSIGEQANIWTSSLDRLKEAAGELAGSSYISGNTADRMKDYFNAVYSSAITMLSGLITDLGANWSGYFADYSDVDSDAHFVINTDELLEIDASLQNIADGKSIVENEGKAALSNVSHLTSAVFPDFSRVFRTHEVMHNQLTTLVTDVEGVESKHQSSDFESIRNVLQSVTALLSSVQGQDIIYKTNFDINSFASSSQYQAMVNSFGSLVEDINSKQGAFDRANEARKQAYEQRKAEYEEEVRRRQEKAENIKTLVTIGAIGLSVTASVLTLGMGAGATIGIMAGAGAISGALTAGSDYALDSYVANGFDNIDWKGAFGAAGKGALIGGFTGAVSGAFAYYTPVISNQIGSFLQTEMGLAKPVAEMGTKLFVGTGSKVFTGGVERFSSALYNDKTIKQAWDAAWDVDEVKKDAVKGLVSTGSSMLFDKAFPVPKKGDVSLEEGFNNTITGTTFQGGMKTVYSGVVSRYAGEVIAGKGDLRERLQKGSHEALSSDKMAIDFVTGSASTYAAEKNEYTAKQKAQEYADEMQKEYNYGKGRETLKKFKDEGITGVRRTEETGNLDFSKAKYEDGSSVIYTDKKTGIPADVEFKMVDGDASGSDKTQFVKAYREKIGDPKWEIPKGYTLTIHHGDEVVKADGTHTARGQLVPDKINRGGHTHSGANAQLEHYYDELEKYGGKRAPLEKDPEDSRVNLPQKDDMSITKDRAKAITKTGKEQYKFDNKVNLEYERFNDPFENLRVIGEMPF